ncbi:hypothetical protein BC830DRAFT_865930 [Chytriomyces sp. MP71]|nr:hypothetical protein BC830DRAFT_865930 [Chytriomyces sp. MP71]
MPLLFKKKAIPLRTAWDKQTPIVSISATKKSTESRHENSSTLITANCPLPLIMVYAILVTGPLLRTWRPGTSHVVVPLVPLTFAATAACTALIAVTFHHPAKISHYVIDTIGTGFTGLSIYRLGYILAAMGSLIMGGCSASLEAVPFFLALLLAFVPTMLYAGGLFETWAWLMNASHTNEFIPRIHKRSQVWPPFPGLYSLVLFSNLRMQVKAHKYVAVRTGV